MYGPSYDYTGEIIADRGMLRERMDMDSAEDLVDNPWLTSAERGHWA